MAILDVTQIEKGVEARLVQMIPVIRKSAVQKNGRYEFNNPALAISIYESGEWVKEGKRSYQVPCRLHVLLTVASAKSEEDRRQAANPLVFAIVMALAQQNLGLDLRDPGIEPVRFADVTDEEDWKNNKIVYLIEFGLGFYFQVPAEDVEAPDLIGIDFDYILEAGTMPAVEDESSAGNNWGSPS